MSVVLSPTPRPLSVNVHKKNTRTECAHLVMGTIFLVILVKRAREVLPLVM